MPEDHEEGKPGAVLTLGVRYTPDYPDAPPEMCVQVVEDEEGLLGEPSSDDALSGFSSDTRRGAQHLRAELDQVVRAGELTAGG